MTSSGNEDPHVERRLRDLLGALNPERLAVATAGVTQAAGTSPSGRPVAEGRVAALHTALIELVQRLHADGIGCPRVVDRRQALAEALELLTLSGGGDAYTAALAGLADDPGEAIRTALARVVEVVRERARRRILDWEYARHLGVLDWSRRAAAAALLQTRLTPLLPAGLRDRAAGELVDCLQDLVELDVVTTEQVCAMDRCAGPSP